MAAALLAGPDEADCVMPELPDADWHGHDPHMPACIQCTPLLTCAASWCEVQAGGRCSFTRMHLLLDQNHLTFGILRLLKGPDLHLEAILASICLPQGKL